ncbi:MAG: protein phosphatase CheZ, partial [Zoogloeaceae bacterium]|nr:protein phosphatase CheZ [Zoogloeaceae bacterium]
MTAENDSTELEALFDSIAAETAAHQAADEAAVAKDEWPKQNEVFTRVGQMARQLHTTLHELGYDKVLENAATQIPDAKDRLAYVAKLTEQAASRVLNAIDITKPLVDESEVRSKALATRWDAVYAGKMNVTDFKTLADETRAFLKTDLPGKTNAVGGQLMEIMMAQDFQDLTGQVIKKIVELAHELEQGLMSVLLETAPEDKKPSEEAASLVNGPVVNAEGRTDVVVNQQQV